jgi:hypothetical protein
MTYGTENADVCSGCATPNQCSGCDLAATSGDRFAGVVRAALNTHAVDEFEVAFEFEVMPSAVLRWAAGTSAPAHRIRGLVIKYLEKAMKGETT